MYGRPGEPLFKIMVRRGDWKYIYLANGRRRQLFNVTDDPDELRELSAEKTDVVAELHAQAIDACRAPGAADALDGDELRGFDYSERPRPRFYQFDASRGVRGFPERPEEVWKQYG